MESGQHSERPPREQHMNYSPSQETEMSEHKQTAAVAPPPAGVLIILIIQKIKALFTLFKNIPLHS